MALHWCSNKLSFPWLHLSFIFKLLLVRAKFSKETQHGVPRWSERCLGQCSVIQQPQSSKTNRGIVSSDQTGTILLHLLFHSHCCDFASHRRPVSFVECNGSKILSLQSLKLSKVQVHPPNVYFPLLITDEPKCGVSTYDFNRKQHIIST